MSIEIAKSHKGVQNIILWISLILIFLLMGV